jgi:site-specific recombinase XerD
MIRVQKMNKNKECPVVIRVTYQRKYILIPTNEKIKKEHWNSRDEVPKKICPNREVIMLRIDEEMSKIRNIILQHRVKYADYPTIADLKNLLKKNDFRPQSKDKSIIQYFDDFITDYSKKKKIQKGTQKIYKATSLRLSEFFTQYERPAIWQTFDSIFYTDFVLYFTDKGYKESSIGRIIKTLKTFLGYIHTNYQLVKPEQYKEFKVIKEEPPFEILTKEELLVIKLQLGLVETEKYEWFKRIELAEREKLLLRILLFLCWTGMSYVDFLKLTYNDIDNIEDLDDDSILSIIYNRQKTNINNKVFITLTEDIIELLIQELYSQIPNKSKIKTKGIVLKNESYINKYKTLWNLTIEIRNIFKGDEFWTPNLFSQIGNQIFNKEIKFVLAKIGIDKIVSHYEKRHGLVSETKIEKFKLITSVTGRRTFITHSLKDGIPMEVLMKSTGHKDIKTLLRYAKIDQNVVNSEFITNKKRILPNEKWEMKKQSNYEDSKLKN